MDTVVAVAILAVATIAFIVILIRKLISLLREVTAYEHKISELETQIWIHQANEKGLKEKVSLLLQEGDFYAAKERLRAEAQQPYWVVCCNSNGCSFPNFRGESGEANAKAFANGPCPGCADQYGLSAHQVSKGGPEGLPQYRMMLWRLLGMDS